MCVHIHLGFVSPAVLNRNTSRCSFEYRVPGKNSFYLLMKFHSDRYARHWYVCIFEQKWQKLSILQHFTAEKNTVSFLFYFILQDSVTIFYRFIHIYDSGGFNSTYSDRSRRKSIPKSNFDRQWRNPLTPIIQLCVRWREKCFTMADALCARNEMAKQQKRTEKPSPPENGLRGSDAEWD